MGGHTHALERVCAPTQSPPPIIMTKTVIVCKRPVLNDQYMSLKALLQALHSLSVDASACYSTLCTHIIIAVIQHLSRTHKGGLRLDTAHPDVITRLCPEFVPLEWDPV